MTRQTLNCTNALNAPENGNTPRQVEMCVAAFNDLRLHAVLRQPAADAPARRPARAPPAPPAPSTGSARAASATEPRPASAAPAAPRPATGADCSDSTCADGDRCVGATTTCQAVVPSNGTCDAQPPLRSRALLRGRERQDDDHRHLRDGRHARRRRPAAERAARLRRHARALLRRPDRRQDLHAGHLPRLQRQRQRRRRRDATDGGGSDAGARADPPPGPPAACSPTARASAASPATATRRPVSPPARPWGPASRSRPTTPLRHRRWPRLHVPRALRGDGWRRRRHGGELRRPRRHHVRVAVAPLGGSASGRGRARPPVRPWPP